MARPSLRNLARVGMLIPLLACGDDATEPGASDAEVRGDAALVADAQVHPDASTTVRDASQDGQPADSAVTDAGSIDGSLDASTDASIDIDAQTDAGNDAAASTDGATQDAAPDAAAADAAQQDAASPDAGLTCAQGLADCNGDPADGCEVNTTSSPQHCSACGQTCAFSNATAMCATSSCALGSCFPSFSDCNGNSADGCEINTGSNPRHCGMCFRACNTPNGTPDCSGGNCTIAACNSSFANCNGSAADGCEVNTTNNRLHCGGCNRSCAANQQCVQSLCQ